jgi:hypothetical protein
MSCSFPAVVSGLTKLLEVEVRHIVQTLTKPYLADMLFSDCVVSGGAVS